MLTILDFLVHLVVVPPGVLKFIPLRLELDQQRGRVSFCMLVFGECDLCLL